MTMFTSWWGWIFYLIGVALLAVAVTVSPWFVFASLIFLVLAMPFEHDYPSGL